MNPSDAAKGPESQDWMFKLEDLLLGPVSGKTLIQKLNDGEVTRETPVARPGGAFRRLGEIEAFKLHLAKAEAKLRVEAESRHAIRSRVRTRNVKLAATLTCAAAGVAAAGWGAQWLAIHKPWKVQDPSINWEVLDDPTFGKIAISLPSITKASASKFAEDEVLLPDQPEKPTGAKPGRGDRKSVV